MKNTIKYPLVLFCVCVAAGLALAATFALTFDTIQEKEDQRREQAVVTAFWNVEVPPEVRWENFDMIRVSDVEVFAGYADSEKTELLGYAAIGSAPGYSSTIQIMVGAKPLGENRYKILGVRVLAQQETPGLGARLVDVYTADTLWSTIGVTFGISEPAEVSPTPHEKQAAEALNVSSGLFPPRPPFQAQFAGKVVTIVDGRAGNLTLTTGWEKLVAGEMPITSATAPSAGGEIATMTGATISSEAAIRAIYDAILKIDLAVQRGIGAEIK